MLRQSASKLNPLLTRGSTIVTRKFADKKKTPCSLCPDEAEKYHQILASDNTKNKKELMCNHQDVMPQFDELKKMKNFELKSDCKKFRWLSEGH